MEGGEGSGECGVFGCCFVVISLWLGFCILFVFREGWLFLVFSEV